MNKMFTILVMGWLLGTISVLIGVFFNLEWLIKSSVMPVFLGVYLALLNFKKEVKEQSLKEVEVDARNRY